MPISRNLKKWQLSQRYLDGSIANSAKDKEIANSANEILRIELTISQKLEKWKLSERDLAGTIANSAKVEKIANSANEM